MLVPGVVDGAHLEAGCDHGPVFTHYPGMPVELNAHLLALGGDTLKSPRLRAGLVDHRWCAMPAA
jgi:hypothetical protein